MANERVKSVGGYVMRFVGGVAIILGILGLFSGLSEGNLIGVALSIVFVAGGAVMVKRSGGAGRAREA
ncbi:hypothetical protein V6V47_01825 [Micromonospora sp. CPCC 205539]|uniref:hypothetical protein n=1 Tax=Micromonospora sp. CPCC 205539 TaxID=3122408 RepID=UPI002FEE9C62